MGSPTHVRARIEELVMQFMRDPRNVMLCVEQVGAFAFCTSQDFESVQPCLFAQCGDAATMSTLGKCRKIDPKFQRTAEGEAPLSS